MHDRENAAHEISDHSRSQTAKSHNYSSYCVYVTSDDAARIAQDRHRYYDGGLSSFLLESLGGASQTYYHCLGTAFMPATAQKISVAKSFWPDMVINCSIRDI